MEGVTAADPLMNARALVLRDLVTRGLDNAHVVSVLEDCIAQRRWWVSQWAEGARYVEGLVAQDVQDTLFDEATRWPVCACADPAEHSLSIHPELGPDPRWVCSQSGEVVAPLGELPPPPAPPSPS